MVLFFCALFVLFRQDLVLNVVTSRKSMGVLFVLGISQFHLSLYRLCSIYTRAFLSASALTVWIIEPLHLHTAQNMHRDVHGWNSIIRYLLQIH